MERRVDVVPASAGAWAARFMAMASPCEVLVHGASCADLTALGRIAAEECWRIETKWSRYRRGNIVHVINSAAGRPVTVDDETARLIDYAALLHASSDGCFDLTSGILRRVWKFAATEGRVPRQREVEALLALIGWHRVEWCAPVLRLKPGMEIDFGGIGKEYAVDRAAAMLTEATSLPALINFGGDLVATRERTDGSPWRVGIDSGVPHAATPLVQLTQGAVATSGDHHRHIDSGGRRYGHILDPRTGWPPPDAPRSVTVACATCVEAGSLSTVAMLQGADAERWLGEQELDFHVVRDEPSGTTA